VKPRPHNQTKCGLRFPPQYHISCKWGYYSAPLYINVFSSCYVLVSRPITTLDFVLLSDNNRDLLARSGPEINSGACLCVLQGPRHNTRSWFSIQRFIFLLIFCLEIPERRKSNKPLKRPVACELVGDFISSQSGMPRDPIQPHSVPSRDNFQHLLALS
jgi:hypothetical protein